MTSTTAPATFLPSPQMYDGSIAAELRQVTSGSNRHHRHQRLRGGVSLELRRGEVTTLLSRYDGSAGRLLDLLDGRAPASQGSVRVAGHDVSGLDPRELFRLRREQVARVQPGYGIYPKLTVRQNLAIAQRRSGRRADLGWIDDVAEALGLSGRLGYHHEPGADARRARWAVARSLVARPALLLLDHVSAPLAWPDKPALTGALRLATSRLWVAAVIASHDPGTAAATDRVVLMNQARVIDDTGAARDAS
jgi:putative ABC transport system ATP-binding protein